MLTILPGTLPEEELTARLAATDSAVVMKLGRTFPAVRARAGGVRAAAPRRATSSAPPWPGERTGDLADMDPESVPYFAVAVLPSRVDAPTGPAPSGARARGEVVVVGTGPAGPLWLTPETRGALAAADDLVGYTTYLDRVPVRPGQRRHGSDNKVESERAEFALDLARRGRRVAVVSGGDPGVFAMATAVLEVASQDAYADVPVRVLPGVTAANAAAARAGAPLGHDYATHLPLRPPQAVGGHRGAPARGGRGRPGAGPLQPRLPQPHLAGGQGPRTAPGTPLPGHPGGARPRRRAAAEESVRTVRLADLDPEEVDMRTILIVGSSQTRWVAARRRQQIVWTPRRYPRGAPQWPCGCAAGRSRSPGGRRRGTGGPVVAGTGRRARSQRSGAWAAPVSGRPAGRAPQGRATCAPRASGPWPRPLAARSSASSGVPATGTPARAPAAAGPPPPGCRPRGRPSAWGRSRAAAVLRDQDVDAVAAQQLPLALQGERAPVEQHLHPGRTRRPRARPPSAPGTTATSRSANAARPMRPVVRKTRRPSAGSSARRLRQGVDGVPVVARHRAPSRAGAGRAGEHGRRRRPRPR